MSDKPSDPRQSAYDAVFAYLHSNPSRAEIGYEQAVANARVWRAVEAALDAMDIPKVPASELYPLTSREDS
jgi:hypothetical protein